MSRRLAALPQPRPERVSRAVITCADAVIVAAATWAAASLWHAAAPQPGPPGVELPPAAVAAVIVSYALCSYFRAPVVLSVAVFLAWSAVFMYGLGLVQGLVAELSAGASMPTPAALVARLAPLLPFGLATVLWGMLTVASLLWAVAIGLVAFTMLPSDWMVHIGASGAAGTAADLRGETTALLTFAAAAAAAAILHGSVLRIGDARLRGSIVSSKVSWAKTIAAVTLTAGLVLLLDAPARGHPPGIPTVRVGGVPLANAVKLLVDAHIPLLATLWHLPMRIGFVPAAEAWDWLLPIGSLALVAGVFSLLRRRLAYAAPVVFVALLLAATLLPPHVLYPGADVWRLTLAAAGQAAGGVPGTQPVSYTGETTVPRAPGDSEAAGGGAGSTGSGDTQPVNSGAFEDTSYFGTPVLYLESPVVSYLRGAVLDHYENNTWTATPGAPGNDPYPAGLATLVDEKVTAILPLPHFYSVGMPVAVDSIWGSVSQPNGYLNPERPIPPGGSYRVRAWVLDMEKALPLIKASKPDYPEDIRKYYLQLPDTVPPRVGELARQITRGARTTYQKVQALQAYLLAYPYSLYQETVAPAGRDVVDHFLFDMKAGYCEYFASAMAILAREVGIPSRYVNGYIMSKAAGRDGVYVYIEPGHAWTEIYFAGVGWVTVDATSSRMIDPVNPFTALGPSSSVDNSLGHPEPAAGDALTGTPLAQGAPGEATVQAGAAGSGARGGRSGAPGSGGVGGGGGAEGTAGAPGKEAAKGKDASHQASEKAALNRSPSEAAVSSSEGQASETGSSEAATAVEADRIGRPAPAAWGAFTRIVALSLVTWAFFFSRWWKWERVWVVLKALWGAVRGLPESEREEVIRRYARWLATLERRGAARRRGQTPLQFALSAELPHGVKREFLALTWLFYAHRYGSPDALVRRARLWRRLLLALRSLIRDLSKA